MNEIIQRPGFLYDREDKQYVERRPVPIPGFVVAATAESSGAAEFFEIPATIALFEVKRLKVVNTTGTAATLSLSAVPSTASIGLQFREITAFSVGANDVVDLTNFIGGLYAASTMLRAWTGTASSLVLRGHGEAII